MESAGFQIRQILNSELTEGNKQMLMDTANAVLNNPLADPFYKYQAATALVNAGQLDRAFKEIEELHKTDPSNLWFLDWLAKYYFETKQYQQAINIRSQIELFDPWNAKNYLQLGILYKQIGNEIDSRNMLNKILTFAPKTNEAKQALLELT
jgi:predicted Zn-dependent protease